MVHNIPNNLAVLGLELWEGCEGRRRGVTHASLSRRLPYFAHSSAATAIATSAALFVVAAAVAAHILAFSFSYSFFLFFSRFFPSLGKTKIEQLFYRMKERIGKRTELKKS